MPEYLRVATFEAGAEAIDTIVREIGGSDGPPEGVPAIGIRVLADRSKDKLMIAVRFASEDDLRRGSATLDAMSPPAGAQMRRTSVDVYEVVLERNMALAGTR